MFVRQDLNNRFDDESMHLGDSVFEDSDPSDTDLWPSTTPEDKTMVTPLNFLSAMSSQTSDSDAHQDSSFSDNFFIDEKYLIYGDKLGMSID